MEWGQLPANNKTCSHFDEWVQNFYDGGYLPVNPGEGKQDFKVHKILFQEQWKKSRMLRETKCGT